MRTLARVKTSKKSEAARLNGRKGGRPATKKDILETVKEFEALPDVPVVAVHEYKDNGQ